MNKEFLKDTVTRLLAEPKGILAIDESMATCNKRFEKLGVPTTIEKRQEYRELLITTPEIEKYISGYILFDETIRQTTKDARDFTEVLKSKGIDIGIKVDTGTKDFNDIGEKITEGLDGLPARLKEYREKGATFAKWRGVYTISDKTPTEECIRANAVIFAKYAQLCQEEDIVPIVEPEVLIDGDHSIDKCYEITAHNLDIVFQELKSNNVYLPGVILKTSMVIAGTDAKVKSTTEEVAKITLKCLDEHTPSDLGGIVFLSGGQEDEEATLNLNKMHEMGGLSKPLTFSYGRAIQNGALKAWAENPSDMASAQRFLLDAASRNSLASIGKYK